MATSYFPLLLPDLQHPAYNFGSTDVDGSAVILSTGGDNVLLQDRAVSQPVIFGGWQLLSSGIDPKFATIMTSNSQCFSFRLHRATINGQDRNFVTVYYGLPSQLYSNYLTRHWVDLAICLPNEQHRVVNVGASQTGNTIAVLSTGSLGAAVYRAWINVSFEKIPLSRFDFARNSQIREGSIVASDNGRVSAVFRLQSTYEWQLRQPGGGFHRIFNLDLPNDLAAARRLQAFAGERLYSVAPVAGAWLQQVLPGSNAPLNVYQFDPEFGVPVNVCACLASPTVRVVCISMTRSQGPYTMVFINEGLNHILNNTRAIALAPRGGPDNSPILVARVGLAAVQRIPILTSSMFRWPTLQSI